MPTHDEWKHINEARTNYIARRNRENETIETLTPEQHEALQFVCYARHQLHVGHEEMFRSSNANYNDLWDSLDSCCETSINSELEKVGLPKISGIDLERDNFESYDDWYDLMYDDDRAEYNDDINAWIEEVYSNLSDALQEVNRKIESYLRTIDEEHGTNYCPSGSQRI